MLQAIESVIFFVPDIHAAAAWYATLLGAQVQYENPHYAFVYGPGVVLGFHSADEKSPAGIGSTTVYWEVANLAQLEAAGATRYLGPMTTSHGAQAAMLKDPFGCCIGLNQPSAASRAAADQAEDGGTLAAKGKQKGLPRR